MMQNKKLSTYINQIYSIDDLNDNKLFNILKPALNISLRKIIIISTPKGINNDNYYWFR